VGYLVSDEVEERTPHRGDNLHGREYDQHEQQSHQETPASALVSQYDHDAIGSRIHR
jgi:hypothetical protein